MHFYEKYKNAKILNKNWFLFLSSYTINFLNSQINGAMFIIMRLWGKISFNLTQPNFKNLTAAIIQLQSVQIFNGFLIDTMEFEKTYTILLFLAY